MTDYYTRDQTHILEAVLEWKGKNFSLVDGFLSSVHEWSPYRATLTGHVLEANIEVVVSFRFCHLHPAFVMEWKLVNAGEVALDPIQLHTRWLTAIRTCHDYNWHRDSAHVWFDSALGGGALFTSFADAATQDAELFLANGGVQASHYEAIQPGPGVWSGGGPGAGFSYTFPSLLPGSSVTVVQLLGSARRGEGRGMVQTLLDQQQWKAEVEQFEASIVSEATNTCPVVAGRGDWDLSSDWASQVIQTNRHYLQREIVAMPCPAEYNFWFLHDNLHFGMLAVTSDPARIQHDLRFVLSHADNDTWRIPHAFYWSGKNATYVTKWVQPDSWNHCWFIIVSARYVRHTGDLALASRLLPFLRHSLEALLAQEDPSFHVLSRHQPDWWDIGHATSRRSYITHLTIQGIREYVSLCSQLLWNDAGVFCKEDDAGLWALEQRAQQMDKGLFEHLWDDTAGYFQDYLPSGGRDPHFFTGPLLAAHWGLFRGNRTAMLNRLLATVDHVLHRPPLGILNAAPMDFQEEKWINEYQFSGNEAADPGLYFNGGVWHHGNAWYALALLADGQFSAAAAFLQSTMSLQGVQASEQGQPAFYEYRNGRTGAIDKPQFLWGACWWLYAVLHLYGYRETEWGYAIVPEWPNYSSADSNAGEVRMRVAVPSSPGASLLSPSPSPSPSSSIPLHSRDPSLDDTLLQASARILPVHIVGAGPWISSVRVGHQTPPFPSAVVPLIRVGDVKRGREEGREETGEMRKGREKRKEERRSKEGEEEWWVVRGDSPPVVPIVEAIDSLLLSVRLINGSDRFGQVLWVQCAAFVGHQSKMVILSPWSNYTVQNCTALLSSPPLSSPTLLVQNDEGDWNRRQDSGEEGKRVRACSQASPAGRASTMERKEKVGEGVFRIVVEWVHKKREEEVCVTF